MKPADKRLFEFGNQVEQHFKNNGFGCNVIRQWNNEYEIALSKPGDYDTVEEEMKTHLTKLGFTPVLNPPGKEGRCLYANLEEMIGCDVDPERHYIAMFSEYWGGSV